MSDKRLDEKDIEILVFLNKYRYVKSSDFSYLYSSKIYYKKVLKFLESNKYIKKDGWYYVVGSNGIKKLKELGYKYYRRQSNKAFTERQKIISHFAARYYNNSNIKFLPSVDVKDKEVLTITARRYIGVLKINQKEYLTYYISSKHTQGYIRTLIYDIRKERIHKEFIVFVEDIGKINMNDFVFGKDKIYIIPKIEENIHIIENINKINNPELFKRMYKDKVYLSGHTFCEYYINQNHFVYTLPLIDTEQLSTIKYFLLENKNKQVDILYSKNIPLLKIGKIEGVNYIPVDYGKYIKEEFNCYEQKVN